MGHHGDYAYTHQQSFYLKPYQVHIYRLGSLENSLWYQYLNNLLFLLLELHLHTKTLLLGPLTEQSAQKALITAMMADDPDE